MQSQPTGKNIQEIPAQYEAERIAVGATKTLWLVGGGSTMVYGRYNELVNGDYNGL